MNFISFPSLQFLINRFFSSFFYHYFWKSKECVHCRGANNPPSAANSISIWSIHLNPARPWQVVKITFAQTVLPFLSSFSNSDPITTSGQSALRFTSLSPLFCVGIQVWVDKSYLSLAFCFSIAFVDSYFVPCTVPDASHDILFFPLAIWILNSSLEMRITSD